MVELEDIRLAHRRPKVAAHTLVLCPRRSSRGFSTARHFSRWISSKLRGSCNKIGSLCLRNSCGVKQPTPWQPCPGRGVRGRPVGVRATIVMPGNASAAKLRTAELGAEIVRVGVSEERRARAEELATERRVRFWCPIQRRSP